MVQDLKMDVLELQIEKKYLLVSTNLWSRDKGEV